MSYDLVVKNAKVLGSNGELVEVNIGIRDGYIWDISLSKNMLHSYNELVNAEGLLALPSFIDLHVHIFSPGWNKETISSGTKAATLGGYGLICDMASVGEWQTVTLENFRKKQAAVNSEAYIDVCLYAGEIYKEEDLKEIPRILEEGAVGLGEIMLSEPGPIGDDALLVQSMNVVKQKDKIIAIHAENKDIVNYYTKKVSFVSSLEEYASTRPPIAEAEAVLRVAMISRFTNSRTHICHLSSAAGCWAFKKAKKIYPRLTSEVTPHHLILDIENASKLGALATVTPPLRKKEDRIELWKCLKEGLISAISTDHAAFYSSDKLKSNYLEAPPGLPGLEVAFPIVATYAVKHNLIPLDRIVEFFTTKPAKILRLKSLGSIEVGKEANIVLVNYKTPAKVSNEWVVSASDYTPYEGYEVYYWPVHHIFRGKLVLENRAFTNIRPGRYRPL